MTRLKHTFLLEVITLAKMDDFVGLFLSVEWDSLHQ